MASGPLNMTPPGAAYDRNSDLQRSRRAAARHALVSGSVDHVPIPWTPGNVLRLIGVLAVGIGTLAALAQWTIAAYRDEAASRSVVHDYFEAIETGEAGAGFAVGCSDPPLAYADWGMADIADALSATSITESGVLVDSHLDGPHGLRFHDFEVPGRARGAVLLQATGDSAQPWRVCGLVAAETTRPM